MKYSRIISRCACAIAINIVCGYLLKFIPNVKITFSLIIGFTIFVSFKEAILIAFGTVMIQALLY